MTLPRTRWIAAALGGTLAVTGCGGAHRQAVQTSPRPAPANAGDLTTLAQARADSARHLYTEADVRFMSGMIGHHAQAIVMARWAPTHGANSSVRTLAERIISSQQDEIVTMQQWLRDRNRPVPEPGDTGMHMMHGSMPGMLMPGMLTEAQMSELDGASGSDFDRLFLTFMIQHHSGAVSMVKDLFGSYGAGQDEAVFKFASDVNVDQSTEIARMQQMLATLTPERSSP